MSHDKVPQEVYTGKDKHDFEAHEKDEHKKHKKEEKEEDCD